MKFSITSWKEHDDDVAKICQVLSERSNTDDSFVISKNLGDSNTTRQSEYRKTCRKIPVAGMKSIIEVDTTRKTITCQARVPMVDLFHASLASGMIPAVGPEFAQITVAGAALGAALESSSFRFGQFSDQCLRVEVVQGNGNKVWCSKTENPDLFHALPGSYGSLGIVTCAEIQCLPAKQFVHVKYRKFLNSTTAVNRMKHLSRDDGDDEEEIDFVEGTCLDTDVFMVMEGILTNDRTAAKNNVWGENNRWYSEWYVQHVQSIEKMSRKQSLKEDLDGDINDEGENLGRLVHEEVIPIETYLLRWNRGAFWMGYHPFQSKFLTRMHVWLVTLFIVRLFVGWLATTQRLFRALHSAPVSTFENRMIVQDCYIPENNVSRFIAGVSEVYGIFPMWLCPVRGFPHCDQFLSPSFAKKTSSSLYINVGIYGAPRKVPFVARDSNHNLEDMVKNHGGRKMLYAQSFYDENEFWSIYDRRKYQSLREKFHASCFVDVYKKISS